MGSTGIKLSSFASSVSPSLRLRTAKISRFESFNATIFQSNSRQDYQIDMVNMTNTEGNTDGWKVLPNSVWSQLYSIPYVAGYGDLRLVVESASLEVRLDSNWGVSLSEPSYDETANKSEADRKYCDWKPWLVNTPIPGFHIQLDTSTGTISPVENGTGYQSCQ
jgi:hypothetical protein